jgi:hypothetical protein
MSCKVKRKQIIAYFFLGIILLELVPLNALALSSEMQPEFASFESTGSPDLVNLITGDFNYNIPLVKVPGPEGDFDVPLFYHSGIKPESDASWAGLGWNVNVGCISRDIQGYPDDAYDAQLSVNVNDPGGRGYANNYLLFSTKWDSQKGYGGGVSLLGLVGVEWWDRGGLESGTILGVNFNKDGITQYWADAVFAVASSVFTIAGISESIAAAQEVGSKAGETAAKAASRSSLVDAASTALNIGTTIAMGAQSEGKFSSRYHNWSSVVTTSALGFRTDYAYWLDDTRTERAFGSLYLGSLNNSTLSSVTLPPNYNSTINGQEGTEWPRTYLGGPSQIAASNGFKKDASGNTVCSDMFTYVGPNEVYGTATKSTHISFDTYNVMSPGLGGSISPYRLETGTLAQPKRYSWQNYQFNVVPYVQEDDDTRKTQFVFNGQFQNYYNYHNDVSFGIDQSIINLTDPNGYLVKHTLLTINNDKFKGSSIDNDPSRIKNRKVVAGSNIDWYSNETILSGLASSKGFMDYNVNSFARNDLPAKGIGGFAITKEDGSTYYYALPVYRTQESSYVGVGGAESTKYSKYTDANNQVALTWLLTGITGPDFVDRGQIGLIDDQDWGYWVKFDYGRTSSFYSYRSPYNGLMLDNNVQYSSGVREQYYLNSVETRSHIALFIKGYRTDALSSYFLWNNQSNATPGEIADGATNQAVPSMSLDEIILLRKGDFSTLSSLGFKKAYQTNSDYLGNSYLGNIYDINDISQSASYRSFIDSKSLKRVKFQFDQSLCPNTTNSFASFTAPPPLENLDAYTGKGGKLTLKRLQFFGANSVKLFPDYKFDYSSNPSYARNKWDGWGFYSSYGSSRTITHTASPIDADGYAWSLTDILLPTGGTIKIEYERDVYSSISGTVIPQKKGGDVRVASLTLSDSFGFLTKTKFDYVKEDNTSSGVVAKEPAFIKDTATNPDNFGLDNFYDYPYTPVLYSRVVVNGGYNKVDGSYSSKVAYSFETPHSTMIAEYSSMVNDYQMPGYSFLENNYSVDYSDNVFFKQYYNKVDIRTAKIGKLKSVNVMDQNNAVISSTNFTYSENLPNSQGLYTSGSLLCEWNSLKPVDKIDVSNQFAMKLLRTTKTFYPYQLTQINSSKDGLTHSTIFRNWDFFTGESLVKDQISSLGVATRTVKRPAYSFAQYTQMGPKSLNSSYKNMLSQSAANYVYKLNDLSTPSGLLSGVSTSWYANWNNYRDFDPTTQTYQEGLSSSATPVWRKQNAYVYKGNIGDVKGDGSLNLSGFNEFDFNPLAVNNGWMQTTQILRYDHFSLPVETYNSVSKITSSIKRDVNGKFVLATGANTKYSEVAYSGAEDGDNTSVFFGGEVARASGSVVTGTPGTASHTGQAAVQLAAGNKSFVYKPYSLVPGRKYRIYAWTNSLNGAVYYNINNTGDQTAVPQATAQVGNWYRVYLDVTAPASFTSFEVGVKSLSGTVTFDDFKFQPLDAAVSSNVYNASTGYLEYVLDNDHYYTRYQYDDRGIVIKTYQESLKYGGEKLVSEKKYNYKRFNTNQ